MEQKPKRHVSSKTNKLLRTIQIIDLTYSRNSLPDSGLCTSRKTDYVLLTNSNNNKTSPILLFHSKLNKSDGLVSFSSTNLNYVCSMVDLRSTLLEPEAIIVESGEVLMAITSLAINVNICSASEPPK